MSKDNKKVKKQPTNVGLKTINADLSKLFLVDYMAYGALQELKGTVTDNTFSLLLRALQGFEAEMQLAIAISVVGFVKDKVLRKTNCLSADTTLMECYFFIAKEMCMDINEVGRTWFSMVGQNDYPVL